MMKLPVEGKKLAKRSGVPITKLPVAAWTIKRVWYGKRIKEAGEDGRIPVEERLDDFSLVETGEFIPSPFSDEPTRQAQTYIWIECSGCGAVRCTTVRGLRNSPIGVRCGGGKHRLEWDEKNVARLKQ